MDTQELITEQQKIQVGLRSSKSAERRKAAQQLSRLRDTTLGEDLYQAYVKEQLDKRTWETQVAMIRALGDLNYKAALPAVTAICQEDKELDEITRAAASTYVRLKRSDLTDASPVLHFLAGAHYSLAMGLMDALGYDRMMPPTEHVDKLISLINEKVINYPKGFCDPRYGLAAAAAGWDRSLVKDFLASCVQSNDAPLKYVAKNALKGKYVKLR